MTTKLSQPVYEMIQTLLDVRNTLEDVKLDAGSLMNNDANYIWIATVNALASIDNALDLIKYDE